MIFLLLPSKSPTVQLSCRNRDFDVRTHSMNQLADGADYCTRVVDDLAAIGEAKWNALVAASGIGNPFVRYEFLHALHSTSGCAAPRSGWEMQYLTLWRGDQLAGAVPLYRKHHSYGEYVFDWAWASAYQQHGIHYYPKWLAAIPFTPVPGARLIARDSIDSRLLAHAACALRTRVRRHVVAARAVRATR